MRLLFLGDIVGKAGRKLLIETLPGLRKRYRLDVVIANGENAAGGFGITEAILQSLLDAGVDVVTGGNHSWDQREALVFIERHERLLRPLNYPPGTPGRGRLLLETASGAKVLVINLMGRVFMANLDCPFRALEAELEAAPLRQVADAIIVDFHAEATSEKQALGAFADGRVSLVIGTHTHTPTADDRVLPGGTAFMTDVGMCGVYESVVGMRAEEAVRRFTTAMRSERFEPAKGEATLSGLAVEIDDATGLARRTHPLRLGGSLRSTEPLFWVE